MTLLPATPCALDDDTAVTVLFPSIFLKQRSHNLRPVTGGSEDLGVSKHLQVGASTSMGSGGDSQLYLLLALSPGTSYLSLNVLTSEIGLLLAPKSKPLAASTWCPQPDLRYTHQPLTTVLPFSLCRHFPRSRLGRGGWHKAMF